MVKSVGAAGLERIELSRLTERIGKLYSVLHEAAEAEVTPLAGAWTPAVDVCETADAVCIRVEVPGVSASQIRIGLNGIVCFSSYLLTLSSTFGFATAGLSFLIGGLYAVMKVLGFPFPIGNPTVVVLILFMGGVQLISVGILGEYIARIYEEVKQRPKFIVDRALGFEESKALPLHVLATEDLHENRRAVA